MDTRAKRIMLAGVVALEIALLAGLTQAGTGSPMAGIVVARGAALVEADNQSGVMDSIRVVRVVAPAPSWVVIRLDASGAPGMPVGRMRVPAGTSTAFDVPLKAMGDLTPVVWVSVFADAGRPGSFEANMADMAASRDKPYVVDGREVVARVGVQQSGISADRLSAAVDGARMVSSREVRVEQVTAPAASWLVVEAAPGSPAAGTVFGIVPIAPGTLSGIRIPIGPVPASTALQVSLRADIGKRGRFDLADDQAYRIGTTFVKTPVLPLGSNASPQAPAGGAM